MASPPDLLPSEQDLVTFISMLPADGTAFVRQVVETAKRTVNLPGIFKDHVYRSREYAKPITVKKLPTFARVNVFGHFRPMREQVGAPRKGGSLPPWLDALDELLTQPGARLIDRTLALVIALRESGRKVRPRRPGRMANSFRDGGLDNLFANRAAMLEAELVPPDWTAEGQMTKAPPHDAALVPQERLLGFYYARTGLARVFLVNAVAEELFLGLGGAGSAEAEARAEAEVAGMSDIERRIWLALAFASTGGGMNLASVSPGATGLKTVLHAFNLANAPLQEIVDLPNVDRRLVRPGAFPPAAADVRHDPAEMRQALAFLRKRLPQFFRLNIATKSAIVAETLDQHLMAARVDAARAGPAGPSG